MDFKKLINDRHEYAQAWKARTGGKVLGYFEETFPEEIAFAAGILPVRILAEAKPDCLSDKWVYGACFPAKALINQFMLGEYDYLDGLVNVEGCQWIFNSYEVITNNKPEWFKHYLFSPDYTDSKTSKDVFRSELQVFAGKMEELSGNRITDEKLDEAIEVYNKNRFLLRRLCELRRADCPKILGSEFMNVVLADQVMDKVEMNGILEQFIDEVENREPGRDMIRLMLIGSETWNTELEEMCERLGADIVIDELDNGTSYFWNQIYPQKDRLMAISLRYLNRPHNPEKEVKKDFWLKSQEISRLRRPLDTKTQGPQNLDLFQLKARTDRT